MPERIHKIDALQKKNEKSLDIICATAVKTPTTVHVNGNASAFAGPLPTMCLWWSSVTVDMGVLDESSRAIFLLPFLLSS